jgi:hypothetical protein
MKALLTISFILNMVAIILLTYFDCYEMEHRGLNAVTVLLIILTIVSIFTLSRLYFNYMNKPGKDGSTENKEDNP